MILSDLPAATFDHPQLAGRDWTLSRRIAGRHSDLLEFLDAGADRRVFVKRSHTSTAGTPDRRLRREYRALRVLQWRLGPDMSQSLPAPLGAHLDDTVLVVGAVDGVPLAAVLKRNANLLTGWVRRGQLAAAGAATGQWLRRFHDATRRDPMAHDHERFCQDLAAALKRFGPRLDGADAADVHTRLSRASARLAGELLPTAARHGDFLPQNILVQRAGVGVVDFENYRLRETVHRDVGYMIAYASMLRLRRGYLPAAIDAFAAAFERGYGAFTDGAAQRLFTAEGAVRIARDSAHPRVIRAMLKTIHTLVPKHGPEQEASRL